MATIVAMDDQRVGAAFRAVRIRRGWTQRDVAARCGLSASAVSLIERGHLDTMSVRSLRRLAVALEIRLELTARLRTGDVERLLNAGHAALHEALASHFVSLPGWLHAAEVSFSVYGERGVIDILAFHEPTGSLLVVELKTELVSFEDLLSTMDVRTRLARQIAAERGWRARTVSCWVVVADTAPNRRRIREHKSLVRSSFAQDGTALRSWLRQPRGAIRALSFWSISNPSGAKRVPALVRRVRQPKTA